MDEVKVTVLAEDNFHTDDCDEFPYCCGIAVTAKNTFGQKDFLEGRDEDDNDDDYYDDNYGFCTGLFLSIVETEPEKNLAIAKGYRHLFADVWGLWDSDWDEPLPELTAAQQAPANGSIIGATKNCGIYVCSTFRKKYRVIVGFPYVPYKLIDYRTGNKERLDFEGAIDDCLRSEPNERYFLADLACKQRQLCEPALLAKGFKPIARFVNPKHTSKNTLYLLDREAV